MTNHAEAQPTINNSGENSAVGPMVESKGVPRREISINADFLSQKEQELLAELRQLADEREARALSMAEPLLDNAAVDLIQGTAVAGHQNESKALVSNFIQITEVHAGSLSPVEREKLAGAILNRVKKIGRSGIRRVARNKIEFMTQQLSDKKAEHTQLQLEHAKLKIESAGLVSTTKESVDTLRKNYQGDIDILEEVDILEANVDAAITPRLQFGKNELIELHVETAELEAMVAHVGNDTLSPARGTEIAAIKATRFGEKAIQQVRSTYSAITK